MAALKNRRWEAFCQHFVAGAEVAVAYEEAGFAGGVYASANGRKLRYKPLVDARITELQEQSAERAIVQVGWIQHQLLDIARGKTPSRTTVDAKGGVEQVYDRQGALVALGKTLGVGADVSVTAIASAEASAEARMREMSAPELARRLSWVVEEALAAQNAAELGNEALDVKPVVASFDQAQPRAQAALPAPRERARDAVMGVINLAKEIRGDRETLEFLHGVMTKATAAIAELAHAC